MFGKKRLLGSHIATDRDRLGQLATQSERRHGQMRFLVAAIPSQARRRPHVARRDSECAVFPWMNTHARYAEHALRAQATLAPKHDGSIGEPT